MTKTEPSDGALVARARGGDGEAFDALVRRHYRAAFAVALGVLGRRAEAEDICQDAWLRALEKLEECRKPDHFVFWLLQIVRNRARNQLDRRRVRAAEPLGESTATSGESPEKDLARERLRERLERALMILPQVQREIVLLHDLEGLRHRAIAEVLGISEGMSRQHLFQARRRLRERLGGAQGEAGHGKR